MATPIAAAEAEGPLAAARRLAGRAAALAPEIEAARQLPAGLVAELSAAGLLRLGVPAGIGGPETPPAVALQVAEELARGDGSTGWCASIAITSSLLAGYLPTAVAAEVLGARDAVAAGVWAPRGSARDEAGGLRVSGRWAFCSGITHAGWLFAGCVLAGAEPGPQLRVVALPVGELEVLDTWHVAGLRGTGSHDAVADGVLVPHERVLSLLDGGPVAEGALYRFPIFGFFALSVAVAALGNAQGALDELVRIAAQVRSGARRTLADRAAVQAGVGESDAALRAARSFVYAAVSDAWAAAQAGGPVAVELRTALRLAATHATRASAQVATAMYELAGGAAIYAEHPLQRRWRDAHTATAHAQVAPATWELTGRLRLGVPSSTAQL